MKRNLITALVVLSTGLSALVCAVSCQQEEEMSDSEIRFAAQTVSSELTRTVYSGKDENGNNISGTSGYERIDWLSTDKIRINCREAKGTSSSAWAFADYNVTPGATSGRKHTASLSASGADLLWGTTFPHYFYALYPAPETGNSAILNQNSVRGTIPDRQSATALSGRVVNPDMRYAYMYATGKAESRTSEISLAFSPLFTAFEITLLAADDDMANQKLTSVGIKSTQTGAYLAGTFEVPLLQPGTGTLGTVSLVGSGKNEVSLDVSSMNIKLRKSTNASDAYKFTLLALPQAQTNLTLHLVFEGGITRDLKLNNNGSPISVPAMSKVYIHNVTPSWDFSVTVISGGQVVQTTDVDDWIFRMYDYTLSQSAVSIWTGESVVLSAFSSSTPSPSYTYTTTSSLLSLSGSSGESVTLTAGTNPGKATVNVKAERLGIEKNNRTCTVSVQRLQSMQLSESNVTLGFVGGSAPVKKTLTAEVKYHDGTNTGQSLSGGWTWTSNNPSVCSVDPVSGIIRAVSPGDAVITCTITKGAGAGAETLSKNCQVTVTEPYTFSISPQSAILWTGENFVLRASGDAQQYYFRASTGSELILSLQGTQDKAVVTAGNVAEVATVTVTAKHLVNGIVYNYPKVATVTVWKLESLSFTPATVTLPVGGSTTLAPVIYYHDGTNSGRVLIATGENFSWSGNPANICNIDSNGKITALSAGTTTISCSLTKGNVTVTGTCRITVQ